MPRKTHGAGGLTLAEPAVRAVAAERRVAGADPVEVSPTGVALRRRWP